MRLNEGKIGMQESASIAAVAITACSVFLLDSEKAYSRGDATFISLPVSIAVSLAMFILMWCAMRRTGARNLIELFDMCIGKAIGTVLSIVAALIFILYAYRLMARFCILIHGRVFAAAEYESVALWIAVPVAYAAIKGLECISRLAKIFGVLIGALVLISLIIMLPAYDISRLAPFPGDLGKLGMDTISRAADSVAAFLGLICVAGALQGGRNVHDTICAWRNVYIYRPIPNGNAHISHENGSHARKLSFQAGSDEPVLLYDSSAYNGGVLCILCGAYNHPPHIWAGHSPSGRWRECVYIGRAKGRSPL